MNISEYIKTPWPFWLGLKNKPTASLYRSVPFIAITSRSTLTQSGITY